MPSQTNFPFLRLPRELRDLIYQAYVYEKDGYHYDYESGKFQLAQGRPINLAFMYTCKMIAAEMCDIPLKANTLVFSTAYSPEERVKAGCFDQLVSPLVIEKVRLLETVQAPLTSNVRDMVVERYPQFESIFGQEMGIDNPLYRSLERCWGEPRFLFNGFVDYTLDVLFEHRFDEVLHAMNLILPRPRDVEIAQMSQLSSTNPTLWSIPTQAEVTHLNEGVRFWGDILEAREAEWKYTKHRFSAAAFAIRFLRSISQPMLLRIRHIRLMEDHESVAYPECHAMGLVEFCKINSLLHIERRVSIWRNILLAGSNYDFGACYTFQLIDRDESGDTERPVSDESKVLLSEDISNAFTPWIEEAVSLFDAGMPTGCFSLVFDGDPVPDLSSNVFQIVKRDAAWQDAYKEWCKGVFLPDFGEQRLNRCYHSERFPQTVREIADGTSFIRCNFPVGGYLWDSKQILEQNRHNSDIESFEERWLEGLVPGSFQTTAPLPTFAELRVEKLLPREERKAARLSLVRGRDYK